MYNPPTFLTMQVLSDILDEFEWSELYTIKEEDWTIDGIKVRFSKCILYFREGFESNMSVYISKSDGKKYWSSFELIHYIFAPVIEQEQTFKPLVLHKFFSPAASLEKVQFELRDLCIIVQTYLMDCLKGNFSLVDEYSKKHPEL